MIELDFLRKCFKKSCSSHSFMTTDGDLILVESNKGSNFLSTIQATRFVQKYFPLESGDWVAVNDPQSGGFSPFGINFVGRLGNIIWSVRTECNGPWNSTDKWESLGFRLPPMPFKVRGKNNPQIPAPFLDKVLPFEKQIQEDFERLQKFLTWKADALSTPNLKKYFEVCRKILVERISDTPWTESQHKSKTKTGENLSSKVSIAQDLISVDLTGTTPSQTLGLTESMTESVVTYACVQALGCQSIYNSGTEKYFQIVKPRSSWLSVREPASPAQVNFLSFPFLESHLKQLLLKMKFGCTNWKCSVDGWMQLQFADKTLVTTDDLKNNWGQGISGLKLLRTEDNSLVFELVDNCRLFRVEAGEIELHELKPGAQFMLSLED